MQTGFDITEVTSVWRGEDVPDLLPAGFEFWWRGHKWRHKQGGYSDGLSSPQFLHIGADTDSRDWAYPAAVAHDGGYHDALEIWVQTLEPATETTLGVWKPLTLAKPDCDCLFKELMGVLAVTDRQKSEAMAFYEAVNLFGQAAFDTGRKLANLMDRPDVATP